jgi:hypothetical protein
VDVEDKNNMKMLSRAPYDNVHYTHQVYNITILEIQNLFATNTLAN